MKKIILNFEKKTDNFKDLVQEAFNMNFLNFLLSEETYSELEKIERINTFTKNIEIPAKNLIFGNLEQLKKEKRLGVNCGFFMELKLKNDEKAVIDLSKTKEVDFIIVSAKDWKVIPFENLIAAMHTTDTDLIALVEDIEEAELMLKTLEIGVDGILITPKNVNDIVQLKSLIQPGIKIELAKAKITKIQNIPESERVCVDSTSLLQPGEGFLVGSTALGFVLIHSETFETTFVNSRPFRVNAGDVSAYILVPNDDPEMIYQTNYLSELKGGKRVLAVNYKGETRIVSIGRVKIEIRPMLRFELEVSEGNKKIPLSCICQNAETIRLVDPDGKAKSVVAIKIGDEVLVHIGPGATHFGTAIKESILEK
ncbi:MAG: 3-dehydroquinate synthase II [Promethearchaeota archaeon Loki_b31]|nr:MAG: 3-dehydroquinate synthase II [Candidatus Lokiarchaeota archaeon Loki_b31]